MTKTNYLMLIGTAMNLVKYKDVRAFVFNEELCRVSHCKYLSVEINENMN